SRNPAGMAIGPSDGSVLVTDSGDPTTTGKPARIFRIPAGGCSDADPPLIVYEAPDGPNPLTRPIGIAVAQGVPGVAPGMLLVADASADAVFQIDPLAGTSAQLSPTGAANAIDGAWDLQVYTVGTPSPYFVADAGNPRVLDVDPHPPESFTQLALGGAPAALSVLDS